ncbi:lipase maturation factor family protein [Thalassomonas viridans]|uniref:Lipase maturation factor family protein n=1 Tax=Thalassomonas viridans TaxID=137584 RepID=A0AAF0CFC2_9GAMM|nr:lipase maturation factor family protein [Thalassomonas viridans]WDE09134.1 lipase maturation factor family protein [Thalassomonas viridans]
MITTDTMPATAPDKRPSLIYDGDCTFCRYCVDYAQQATGDSIQYQPYQQVQQDFPDITEAQFQASIQLQLANGERYTGARAAFTALAVGGHSGFWLGCYRHLPLFSRLSETLYRFVTRHRNGCYRTSKLMFGASLQPTAFTLTVQVFLRLLALIYLTAFTSFAIQALGLIGNEGILPLTEYFQAIGQNTGREKYWLLPSIFWLSTTDTSIQLVSWGGVLLSLMLLFNILPRLSLLLLYLCYLSLVSAGQIFMSYQWDILLLECGFLAIFLTLRPGLFVWLYRWLLFRFMLQSGLVKLLSGDPNWQQLTALEFHFQTQPLPTFLAWYIHQLPDLLLKGGVIFTYAVELIIPFLILMPRRPRLLAFFAISLFQLCIIATGNYNFFNLLTLALCLLLLDDQYLNSFHRFLASLLTQGKANIPINADRRTTNTGGAGRSLAAIVALVYLLQSSLYLFYTGRFGDLPTKARTLLAWSAPFHVANSYGVFAVMTTKRLEIIFEGSNNGIEWQPYRLPYQAGDINRAPVWATPHQPRLDWQLWFAALETPHIPPWINGVIYGLLLDAEPVLSLFFHNPYAQAPPKFVRGQLYLYRFSTYQEREKTGAWWQREYRGEYFPARQIRISIRQPEIPGR